MDPTASIGAIKQMAATLSNLGSELASVAPSGGFASVMSQVNAEMAAIEGGGSTGAASPSSSGTAPGSSLGSYIGAAGLGSGPVALAGSGIASTSVPNGQAVVADAQQYLGVPYQWGGTNPATGLDCSGLVQRVYGDLGIQMPRTSQEQATVGTAVANLASAQPGDLVFFDPSASGPGHVGIYIGNGQMIDAPHTGAAVRVDGVGTPSAIRRIIPTGAASSTIDLTSAYSAGSTSAAMNNLGVPASLQPLFSSAGSRYGIDPVLLAAVAKQESGFQPYVVSSAGAQGIMQMMPSTAAGLGVSPFDPASAINGAAQLLSGYLQNYGGSVPMALAAYNAGPAAVAAYGGVPPYAETQGYVANITSMLSSAGAAAGTGSIQ